MKHLVINKLEYLGIFLLPQRQFQVAQTGLELEFLILLRGMFHFLGDIIQNSFGDVCVTHAQRHR